MVVVVVGSFLHLAGCGGKASCVLSPTARTHWLVPALACQAHAARLPAPNRPCPQDFRRGQQLIVERDFAQLRQFFQVGGGAPAELAGLPVTVPSLD